MSRKTKTSSISFLFFRGEDTRTARKKLGKSGAFGWRRGGKISFMLSFRRPIQTAEGAKLWRHMKRGKYRENQSLKHFHFFMRCLALKHVGWNLELNSTHFKITLEKFKLIQARLCFFVLAASLSLHPPRLRAEPPNKRAFYAYILLRPSSK